MYIYITVYSEPTITHPCGIYLWLCEKKPIPCSYETRPTYLGPFRGGFKFRGIWRFIWSHCGTEMIDDPAVPRSPWSTGDFCWRTFIGDMLRHPAGWSDPYQWFIGSPHVVRWKIPVFFCYFEVRFGRWNVGFLSIFTGRLHIFVASKLVIAG